MIIDSSYFVGDISIPHTASPDVSSNLNSLIGAKEKEYLVTLMGYELYKVFHPATLSGSVTGRYADILNGQEFTGYDGKLKRWEGLVSPITTDNPTPSSPIADYVFYYYLLQKHTMTTGIGQVKPKGQNSTPVSEKYKACAAWNSMVDKSILLYQFLRSSPTVYPEYNAYLNDRGVSALLTKIHPFY